MLQEPVYLICAVQMHCFIDRECVCKMFRVIALFLYLRLDLT